MSQPPAIGATKSLAPQPKAYSYIRFSSPAQEKGDSLRRQVEAAREYAQQRGLMLDDQLHMTERGVSAYKGRHRDDDAALGEFLRLVKTGAIPSGSLLIVENLDRLSREQVLDALSVFTDIIRGGIRLLTLQDGQEYTKQSINDNWAQLIVSIAYMARAHEESAATSKRTAAAWTAKRQRAERNGRPMTRTVPAWIEVADGVDGQPTGFRVIEERAAAIRRVFDLKLDGMGVARIARILNQDPLSWKPDGPNQKTAGWRQSYVRKLVRSRTVIGELPPRARQAQGKPIPNYYPAIVDATLFQRVQRLLSERAKRPGRGAGSVGYVRNLFRRLMYCAHCGGSITLENKGVRARRGHLYLRCDTAHRGRGCTSRRLPYTDFEVKVLEHCLRLDVADVVTDGNRNDDLARLHQELHAIEIQRQDAEVRSERFLDAIGDESDTAAGRKLREKAETEQIRAHDLAKRCEEMKSQITDLERSTYEVRRQLDDLRALADQMASLEGEQRIQVRVRLRETISHVVESIEVDTQNRNAALWLGPKSGSLRQRFDFHVPRAATRAVRPTL